LYKEAQQSFSRQNANKKEEPAAPAEGDVAAPEGEVVEGEVPAEEVPAEVPVDPAAGGEFAADGSAMP